MLNTEQRETPRGEWGGQSRGRSGVGECRKRLAKEEGGEEWRQRRVEGSGSSGGGEH